MHASALERVHERTPHVLLADELGEFLRAPCTRQRGVAHERSQNVRAVEAARTSLSPGTRHRRCRCCLPALTGFTTGRRGETDAGHHSHVAPFRWRRGWDCSRPDGRSSLASLGTDRRTAVVSHPLAAELNPPAPGEHHARLFITIWRRGWDSNPRTPVEMLLEFQSSALDRSATSPINNLQWFSRSNLHRLRGLRKRAAHDKPCARGPHQPSGRRRRLAHFEGWRRVETGLAPL